MTRVALLTREYPPEVYGGAGVHVEHLARELAHHVDVAVHCFGEPRSDPLVAGAYQAWSVLDGPARHLAALRHLSANLAMVAGVEDADVAHSHTWYANLAGHLLGLVLGIPHVMTTHSLEPLRPWKAEQLGGGYAISSFCERTAVQQAAAVIAVSEGMRRDVLACYPDVDPDRVVVVHNGIDTEVYHRDERDDALARYGVRADRPTAIFVGRITRQKGLLHLLDAAEHLIDDAQLVLCAGAPDTPDIAREVRARVAALQQARDGVVWIEDLLPREDVVQLLSHATVFACPSIYEPFGLVNIEAMACELPVVASAVGGIPEIIVEDQTGHLVELAVADDALGSPADPGRFARDLADRLNALLRDPERAAEMGRAGRRRVVERFAWPAIAERTTALYAEVTRAVSGSR